AAAKGQAVSLPDVDLGPPPAEAPSKKARKRQAEEVEEIVAEQEVEEGEAARAKKPFNKFAIVLLGLAILSLGAVVAAPYLPGPEGKPTGDYFQKNMSKKPEGIKPDKAMFVAAAPGPIILILLLALLMGLALREWGFLPIALVYIASVLIAGLA